jgi:hypothetical protein
MREFCQCVAVGEIEKERGGTARAQTTTSCNTSQETRGFSVRLAGFEAAGERAQPRLVAMSGTLILVPLFPPADLSLLWSPALNRDETSISVSPACGCLMWAGYTVADPALLPKTKRSGNHSYYSFLFWRFPRGYR